MASSSSSTELPPRKRRRIIEEEEKSLPVPVVEKKKYAIKFERFPLRDADDTSGTGMTFIHHKISGHIMDLADVLVGARIESVCDKKIVIKSKDGALHSVVAITDYRIRRDGHLWCPPRRTIAAGHTISNIILDRDDCPIGDPTFWYGFSTTEGGACWAKRSHNSRDSEPGDFDITTTTTSTQSAPTDAELEALVSSWPKETQLRICKIIVNRDNQRRQTLNSERKDQLYIGASVRFTDRRNRVHTGTVIKINRIKAEVSVPGVENNFMVPHLFLTVVSAPPTPTESVNWNCSKCDAKCSETRKQYVSTVNGSLLCSTCKRAEITTSSKSK